MWAVPSVALLLSVIIVAAGINQSLFLILNHFGHLAGDRLWANLTMLGDGAVALALILPSIRRSPKRYWASLIAAVISVLWVHVLKHVFDVPRPLSVFPPDRFFHTGPAFRAVSFPSGHATAIAAITGIWAISLESHRLLRWLLLALAILVGMSRIMAGVHWPLDVLGGLLGGWLAACAGLMLVDRWGWNSCGISGYVAGIMLVCIAAALLVSGHVGYPSAMPLQRALGAAILIFGVHEMAAMLRYRWLRGSPPQ